MKFSVLSIFAFIFAVYSCDSQAEKTVEPTVIPSGETLDLTSIHCYLYANGKDSIRLSYQQEGKEIKGWMNYDFYEKDGSIGEIEGEVFGDTLRVEFEFLAEGMLSQQEIFFLKKGGKLLRGAGNQEINSDSVWVYKNVRNLSFEDPTPLSELNTCPQDLINHADKEFYMKWKEKN